MVFSSSLFLFIFLPVTLLGYYLLPGKARNYWLLALSLIFFAWMQPGYLWVIVLNIAINYCGALLISHFPRQKKLFLVLSVVCNLGLLFYFKYLDFAIETINGIFQGNLSVLHILLPVGISFFTFQGMSYVIDVYREEVPVQKNLFKVGLYIVLFPQLIAGPIVRYKDIAAEMESRKETISDFAAGIERFVIGLAKKAILANTLAKIVDMIWNNGAGENTWILAWIGSISYTLQIYFDFSGYSDMAIGLGRMFGFHFRENFKLPYISGTITEFWRRWHISLSSWFKDYVYIPLGGNRKHVYRNLLIVFLLTGIWHGAAWNFVLWGLWNGAFILIERLIRTHRKKERSGAEKAATKLYTLFVVNLGWVLFRAPDLKQALQFVSCMFGGGSPALSGYAAGFFLDGWNCVVLAVSLLAASSLPLRFGTFLKQRLPEKGRRIAKYAVLLVLFYFAIMQVVSGSYNPFIYFRF